MNKPGNLQVYNCHIYVKKQYYIAHVTHINTVNSYMYYISTDIQTLILQKGMQVLVYKLYMFYFLVKTFQHPQIPYKR